MIYGQLVKTNNFSLVEVNKTITILDWWHFTDSCTLL